MPGRWDSGFPGAVAVVLLVFVHVISTAVCRRWKLAQARMEEVEHLARLAADEAARAEMEAALAYVPVSIESSGGEYVGGTWRFQCAVCHSPTSTKCSRCKTVRYCSGTCQIIHWRGGHKDECHSPQVDHQDKLQESSSHLSDLQAEKFELLDNTVGNEQKSRINPVATCFGRPSSDSNLFTYVMGDKDMKEIRSFLDSSRTESSSFVDSSSSSTYPGSLENCEEASAIEGLHPRHHAKTGEAVSRDIASDGPKKAAVANFIEVLPVGIGSASLSVNNLSRTVNSKKKLSTCYTKDNNYRLSDSLDSSSVSSNLSTTAKFSHCPSNYKNIGLEFDAFCSDQKRTLGTSSTHENSFANALDGTMESNLKDCRVVGPNKSGYSTSRKSADDWLLKARRLRSLSISLADRAFSGGRRHSVSDDSSSKVNNAPTRTSKFLKSAGLVSNSISDLRTSVKSVVHQLKPSLSSGGLTSMPVSDVCQKYKMNFPYELFAKLYNSEKVDMNPFGLFNCGNSCFANAVLQCLAFTRPLTAYLLQGFHSAKCSRREWCFTCEFENLILKGKHGQSPLSPVGILSHIDRIGSHLAHGREEDAHEFLRYAIDAMQYTCIKETGDAAVNFPEDTSLIQLTFGGYLRSEINCMKCKAKSEQLERMMDLTVEIQGDIGTLEQALKQFTTTEVLDGENRYRCDRCKSFERAKKKLSVAEAPNILTIALKRFRLGKFGKLNKSVRFPVHLDLAPYMSRVDPCPLYNLYAIVVHVDVMNAAFSGHYICYVKSIKGKWYMINDRVVRPVELEKVLKENAYMLFYARKSPQAPSLIKNERCQVPSKTSSWFKKPTNVVLSSEESASLRNSSSLAHKSHDHLNRTTKHPASYEPSDFVGERLYFPRTDSSSDSLSLSCSEEGSWSTESTRNSTSTEELSDYLFGGAQQSRWSRSLHVSDDSDYITHPPSTSRHYFHHEESGEGSEGMGNHSFSHFLYSDRTIHSGMLADNYRGKETDWNSPYGERSNVLMRSSTVKERRHQTLY